MSWLWPGRARHESGIPVDTDADALVVAVQPLFTLAVVILTVITMRPLGFAGWGLVALVLLVVNALIMMSRSLPDTLVSLRVRFWIALIGSVTAGAIWGLDPSSWAEAFAFVLVVHSGVRFSARVSVPLALLCSASTMVVLAVRGEHPWWLGALVLLILPVGLLRRSRREQLATVNELVIQSQRAAAGEERAAIARDLHDVLAHSLSGVNMQLSLADALFEAGRISDGREALAKARSSVVDGLSEARRAVSVLRSGLELIPTLRAMVSGPAETFEVSGNPITMGDDENQAFIRVTQESLTNARRHAPGAPVRVSLSFRPGTVRLEVRNSAAESRPADEGSGMGLVGMRERAAAIGASLSAGPDGPGWTVVLELLPR